MNQRLMLIAVATIFLSSLPVASFADGPRLSGKELSRLPPSHKVVKVRGHKYYYYGGQYYQPRGKAYVVVSAPIGARVKSLPSGYINFGIGSQLYSRVNATYYLWDRPSREYIVVEKPANVDEAVVQNTEVASSTKIFVYPRQDQSDAERAQDRYACHNWANGQTGFDPTLPNQDSARADEYTRAISACLEGRGYRVR